MMFLNLLELVLRARKQTLEGQFVMPTAKPCTFNTFRVTDWPYTIRDSSSSPLYILRGVIIQVNSSFHFTPVFPSHLTLTPTFIH